MRASLLSLFSDRRTLSSEPAELKDGAASQPGPRLVVQEAHLRQFAVGRPARGNAIPTLAARHLARADEGACCVPITSSLLNRLPTLALSSCFCHKNLCEFQIGLPSRKIVTATGVRWNLGQMHLRVSVDQETCRFRLDFGDIHLGVKKSVGAQISPGLRIKVSLWYESH